MNAAGGERLVKISFKMRFRLHSAQVPPSQKVKNGYTPGT